MRRIREPQASSAMQLVRMVWRHNREATGHSWTKLNGSMYDAVDLAIKAGMEFALDDFITMSTTMRIGYWCGDDMGEGWYTRAIAYNHSSAYRAYEAWRKRRPFIFEGDRLHVGTQIFWKGEHWEVSSFADNQSYATIVQREYVRPDPKYPAYEKVKIKRRAKLTHADIRAHNASKRKLTKTQEARAARVEAIRKQLAAGEPTREVWYKVLKDGRSCHGGTMKWSLPRKLPNEKWKPGAWHEVPEVALCRSGLHITRIPAVWWSDGLDVYEVEKGSQGNIVSSTDEYDKAAVKSCRLIRKIEGDELIALGCSTEDL
jgi:hypothetical protein